MTCDVMTAETLIGKLKSIQTTENWRFLKKGGIISKVVIFHLRTPQNGQKSRNFQKSQITFGKPIRCNNLTQFGVLKPSSYGKQLISRFWKSTLNNLEKAKFYQIFTFFSKKKVKQAMECLVLVISDDMWCHDSRNTDWEAKIDPNNRKLKISEKGGYNFKSGHFSPSDPPKWPEK